MLADSMNDQEVQSIRPPKRVLLAMSAAIDIAAHEKDEGPVSGRSIADRHGLETRRLEHILQRLVHAGLLSSQRGPRGGYKLARSASDISLADILLALDNPGDASFLAGYRWLQPLSPVLQAMENDALFRLQKTSLAELCAADGHLQSTLRSSLI